ncbi:MAG: RNA polymerase sigma factor [Bacteroidales bacterium]
MQDNKDNHSISPATNNWEEIYKTYSRKMYAVCLRYARNHEEAEDILHDGFIKVFACLSEYKNLGSFEGWIRRIMVHTAINAFRKYNSRWFPMDDKEQTTESDAVCIEDNIAHDELIKLINTMPDGYRLVFNMYVIEGYKHNEIAEALGITESTSKTQLMKARNYLKNKIGVKTYEKV